MTTQISGDTGVSAVQPSVVAPGDLTQPLTSGTVQATTSGTSVDFTGIPSWVTHITVSWANGSTNGTSIPMVQIGDSGGVETSGYLGGCANLPNAAAITAANGTTGFLLTGATASTNTVHITAVLTLLDPATNLWSCAVTGARSDAASCFVGGGTKSLSATLDRIRLTTVNGTDAFDSGSVNLLYE